jgi:DNA polymerase V
MGGREKYPEVRGACLNKLAIIPKKLVFYPSKPHVMALTLSANARKTFFHRAKDNSMEGAYIPNKALLVVDKSARPDNGSIVVAEINGERLVRRMHRNGDACVLHPENQSYAPLVVKESMQMTVLGVVTAIILEPF